MKILLDPSREGCTVWFVDRDTVTFILGTTSKVCERIYKFAVKTTYKDDYKTVIEQVIDIVLDNKGIGLSYEDCLVKEYGLKVKIVKGEKDFKI